MSKTTMKRSITPDGERVPFHGLVARVGRSPGTNLGRDAESKVSRRKTGLRDQGASLDAT
ncbi:hypothetical protein LP421_04710 (plasmid) [Rhizobium sp. RCAM05350]|nr:hypothetical protein LP421_04710 [Rhizobium sp. RCAM05350]